MGKIGQKNKFFFELIARCNDSKDTSDLTSQATTHSSDLRKLLTAVNNIGNGLDIASIINCERMLIKNDINRLADDKLDKGSSTSLENASRDLEKAFTNINAVSDINGYKPTTVYVLSNQEID